MRQLFSISIIKTMYVYISLLSDYMCLSPHIFFREEGLIYLYKFLVHGLEIICIAVSLDISLGRLWDFNFANLV